MSEQKEFDNYDPLFELGLFDETSPACKVMKQTSIGPIELAALVTALFETVMRAVPDHDQIEFEKRFHKAFSIMLEERFDYDVTTKYLEEDEE